MNLVSKKVTAMLALVLAGYLSSSALAGGDCCGRCGGEDSGKVCRLVYEEKTIKAVCWSCKCEDFCLPGPSTRGCRNEEDACGKGKEGCDDKNGCSAKGGCDGRDGCRGDCLLEDISGPAKFVWFDWIPGCATQATKKKLMRRTVEKKVKSYKWVVEDLCKGCEGKVPAADIEPGADVPPPPPVEARLKYGNPKNLPVKFTTSNATARVEQPKKKSVTHIFTSFLK